MNLDKGFNLTLRNYDCNSILSVCLPSDKNDTDTCKNVEPITIWATDPKKSKIRMYLPYVGNIVARKFTDTDGTQYYGFVAQYVFDTDIQEFNYDSSTNQLSITDSSDGKTYISALINKPTTFGKTLYSSFVLALSTNSFIVQPYTIMPVTFETTDKPPGPTPDNKKKLSPIAIIFICLGAIIILIVILSLLGKGSRSQIKSSQTS
jgi:hypothetical protein